jgi:hypothetical protein
MIRELGGKRAVSLVDGSVLFEVGGKAKVKSDLLVQPLECCIDRDGEGGQ